MRPYLSSVTLTTAGRVYTASISAELPDHKFVGCYQSTHVIFEGPWNEEDPALQMLFATEFITEHWFELRWQESHAFDCTLGRGLL